MLGYTLSSEDAARLGSLTNSVVVIDTRSYPSVSPSIIEELKLRGAEISYDILAPFHPNKSLVMLTSVVDVGRAIAGRTALPEVHMTCALPRLAYLIAICDMQARAIIDAGMTALPPKFPVSNEDMLYLRSQYVYESPQTAALRRNLLTISPFFRDVAWMQESKYNADSSMEVDVQDDGQSSSTDVDAMDSEITPVCLPISPTMPTLHTRALILRAAISSAAVRPKPIAAARAATAPLIRATVTRPATIVPAPVGSASAAPATTSGIAPAMTARAYYAAHVAQTTPSAARPTPPAARSAIISAALVATTSAAAAVKVYNTAAQRITANFLASKALFMGNHTPSALLMQSVKNAISAIGTNTVDPRFASVLIPVSRLYNPAVPAYAQAYQRINTNTGPFSGVVVHHSRMYRPVKYTTPAPYIPDPPWVAPVAVAVPQAMSATSHNPAWSAAHAATLAPPTGIYHNLKRRSDVQMTKASDEEEEADANCSMMDATLKMRAKRAADGDNPSTSTYSIPSSSTDMAKPAPLARFVRRATDVMTPAQRNAAKVLRNTAAAKKKAEDDAKALEYKHIYPGEEEGRQGR